tara:strand:- start:266 stop:703 length:438 start_codon:yes stop_codon:yes gene_type:complete
VKKKFSVSSKDKIDWENFVSEMGDVSAKEIDSSSKNLKLNEVKKLDLHGFTLDQANISVEKFIIESFNKGYRKLLIVTGKGSRSKSYDNPYISKKLSILKHAIPDYIERNKNLSQKIIKIIPAEIRDGGEGAFYIFLKNNIKIKE